LYLGTKLQKKQISKKKNEEKVNNKCKYSDNMFNFAAKSL